MRAWRAAVPLAGVLAAVILYPATRGLDAVAGPGQLGPGFWPRLALAGLALASLARAWQAWRAAGPRAAGGAAPAEPAVAAGPPPAISRPALAAGIALILLYVLAAPALGFLLATALFVAAFMRLGGARSAAGIALAAVAGSAALCYLFVRVVYLPLPKGAGPFEDLTIALYRALGIF
jgi:hypothetical protein